jgi:hypothetical protein
MSRRGVWPQSPPAVHRAAAVASRSCRSVEDCRDGSDSGGLGFGNARQSRVVVRGGHEPGLVRDEARYTQPSSMAWKNGANAAADWSCVSMGTGQAGTGRGTQRTGFPPAMANAARQLRVSAEEASFATVAASTPGYTKRDVHKTGDASYPP